MAGTLYYIIKRYNIIYSVLYVRDICYMTMGFITVKILLNKKVKTITSCMECG